ncbi:MAG TPA: helix-turn-helix domain-containing protein [Candidatus Hydrogenedentes bacterium]|nr:helix-turn-helix domain-containing protein [Candidatus Hydrogenedentota bacterium]
MGVHPETLRYMVRKGEVQAFHIGKGKHLRFDPADLENFMHNSYRPAPPELGQSPQEIAGALRDAACAELELAELRRAGKI